MKKTNIAYLVDEGSETIDEHTVNFYSYTLKNRKKIHVNLSVQFDGFNASFVRCAGLNKSYASLDEAMDDIKKKASDIIKKNKAAENDVPEE